jgi:hypothetical protein
MHQVLPHNDTALAGIDLSATRNSLSTLANALTFWVKASFRLRSMTSSASSPDFDRVRQKRSCAFAHVCLERSCTVLTAVQFEAARDHCDRSRPLRRHRMFCVKYATITRSLFPPATKSADLPLPDR